MACEFAFGREASIRLEWPEAIEVCNCARPHIEPLADPLAATAAALEEPLGFPPLAQAIVSGDRVAVALEPGVPNASAVLCGVVRSLKTAGVVRGGLTVVVSPHEPKSTRRHLQQAADQEWGETIAWLEHDASESSSLSYVAATAEGDPVYIHRALADADLVIPVGVLRAERVPGYLGVHGGLFPTFSDQATQERFRAGVSQNWRKNQIARRKEADEAAWLLGVQFTVQVIPGRGDEVLGVLAGEPAAVRREGAPRLATAWRHELPHRTSLVIASIEGGPQQQTWDNVARALEAASLAVNNDGVIALCTELAAPPGPALRQLAAGRTASRKRSATPTAPPDALPAAVLGEVEQEHRVYLLSGLSADAVEELGLGFIESPGDLVRLMRQFDSCLLLGNAQHAIVDVSE